MSTTVTTKRFASRQEAEAVAQKAGYCVEWNRYGTVCYALSVESGDMILGEFAVTDDGYEFGWMKVGA